MNIYFYKEASQYNNVLLSRIKGTDFLYYSYVLKTIKSVKSNLDSIPKLRKHKL